MNHLTHRPPLGPVRRIQLCVAQVGHRLAQACWEAFDRVDGGAAQLVSDRHDRLESSNRITEVGGCVRRHALSTSSPAKARTLHLKPDTTSNALMRVAGTIHL